MPVGSNDFITESGSYLSKSRLAGFNNFAGEQVRIDNRDATGADQAVAGRFTHADAACQAKDDHLGQPE